jgi:Protein of unknown function (DUF3300)
MRWSGPFGRAKLSGRDDRRAPNMMSKRNGLVSSGLALVLLLSCGAAAAPDDAQGTQAAPSEQKIYSSEQLDQMLASVALYPDSLLSQLLMACTYPSDVAQAVSWSKANPKAQGDEAVKQVESQSWDPSVKSLVAFPQVLQQFGDHADWVQKVGDAFLAQPDDVMASVQRLRAQAQKAGNLKSNEQQKVVEQPAPASSSAPSTTVIQIEPTNPQVVYVPTYNPTVVYGAWAYPAYPPMYYPPPPYYYHPVASGIAAGIAFGAGIAIADSLWGGFDWGHNDVHINVNRYNNINVNNRISGNGNVNWNHNAANRRGTPYADSRSRQRYGQGVGGANDRAGYRGHDASREASRQRAQQSFDKSTGFQGGGAGGRNVGASDRGGAANRAGGGGNRNVGGASRGSGPSSHSNAFSGARSPESASRQANRGHASERSMSGGGSRSSGHQVSRPAPHRSGGGGRRR